MIKKINLHEIEILEETVSPFAGILCGGMCEGGVWCGLACVKVI